MFTDTHTHPYYTREDIPTPEEVIKAAIENKVDRMILPNVNIDSISIMKSLAAKFPDNIRLAMGLHPTEVKENADDVLSIILDELGHVGEYVAIGEVGIDLYWDKTFRDKQMDIFARQLEKASETNLPVIIHCRDGLDETLEILSDYKDVNRVFHSFGGTVVDVERILAQKDTSYFGINGIVTFKNSRLREVITAIPKDNLLLETDSPYLAPVPFRGKTNQSAYLPYIATTVAQTINLSVEEIARITRTNSERLFGF